MSLKVINIDIDKSGWYFISCEVCRNKVKSRDKFLWCDNSNKKVCFPIPRYRIQLKVEDSLGMATFILFDSEAEKLLNISAKDLFNKSLEVPSQVINIDIDKSGWYFISCEVCRNKVKSRDKFLWCDNSNKKVCFPIPRYRIQLKVEDSLGMATFILFDSEAEKLLNISAKDLFNKSLE
ncbi:hypothetical protein CFP56_000245, partial [Quercus suber]